MENGSPAIHGLPVKLRGAENKIHNVCFASTRKHPKVMGKIKTLRKLERDENKAMRGMLAAMTKVEEAGGNLTADLQKELDDASMAFNDLTDKRVAAVAAFFEEGLRGAGYSDADIELYFPYFDPDKYQEVVNKAMVGCGRIDFFTEESPTAQS